jgi:ribosome-binding protein aMBF1 (putative translation factor)
MIKNDRAYRITKAAAARFQRAIAGHGAKPAKDSPVSHAAEVSALRAQLLNLQEQIADYETLRSGSVKTLTVSRLEDLPALLIRARIAQGLTHAHLAEKLAVKPQQIQRWEDDDYQSAAFWRLIDVAEALDLSFDISAQSSRSGQPREPKPGAGRSQATDGHFECRTDEDVDTTVRA